MERDRGVRLSQSEAAALAEYMEALRLEVTTNAIVDPEAFADPIPEVCRRLEGARRRERRNGRAPHIYPTFTPQEEGD